MKRIKSTLDFILSAVVLAFLVIAILDGAFGGSEACAASNEQRSLIAGAAR